MSDSVSDEFLEHWIRGWRATAASETSLNPLAQSHALAYEELLQRRKDGQSPEEFVEGMAMMTKDVRPEARAAFLHSLGEIYRHTMMVRELVRPATSEMGPTEEKMAQLLSRRAAAIQCDGKAG